MMTAEKTERNEEIWRRYQAGETMRQIAAVFGISPSMVQGVVARYRRNEGYEKLAAWRDDLVRQSLEDAEVLAEVRDADPPIAFASNGNPLFDPETGRYIKDAGPKMAATDRLAAHRRDLAKLLGLNAPDKAVVDTTVHYVVEGVDTETMK